MHFTENTCCWLTQERHDQSTVHLKTIRCPQHSCPPQIKVTVIMCLNRMLLQAYAACKQKHLSVKKKEKKKVQFLCKPGIWTSLMPHYFQRIVSLRLNRIEIPEPPLLQVPKCTSPDGMRHAHRTSLCKSTSAPGYLRLP